MVDFICKARANTSVILIVVIGICLFLAMPALAGSKVFKGEWRTPQGYPNGFNGYGQLDQITPDVVIVDDIQLPLSPNATYHIPISRYTRPTSIKVGDRVGYLKDRHGRIISLWKIPED